MTSGAVARTLDVRASDAASTAAVVVTTAGRFGAFWRAWLSRCGAAPCLLLKALAPPGKRRQAR